MVLQFGICFQKEYTIKLFIIQNMDNKKYSDLFKIEDRQTIKNDANAPNQLQKHGKQQPNKSQRLINSELIQVLQQMTSNQSRTSSDSSNQCGIQNSTIIAIINQKQENAHSTEQLIKNIQNYQIRTEEGSHLSDNLGAIQKNKKDSSQIQNVIFSEDLALDTKEIRQSMTQIPNLGCLGCIEFLHLNIPFSFESTCQKFHIISTQEAHSNTLKKSILNLVVNQIQSYLFISQIVKHQKGTIFLGFDPKYGVEEFSKKLRSQIQQLTYQIGQKVITLNKFQLSVIPILKQESFEGINQKNLKDHYFGNFVVRLKFNPFDDSFFKNKKKTRGQNQNSQRKISKKLGSHWPVECEKTLSLDFLPSLKKNKVQVLEQSPIVDTSDNTNTIIVKLRSTNDDHLMSKIANSQVKIMKPYVHHREIKQGYQSVWLVSHQCSQHTFITDFKQITKLEDITFAKPQLNLMIVDDHFFTSRKYELFKKRFENLTSSAYIIFNVKKQMRLYTNIQAPIYLVFEHISLAILAMAILVDLGTRGVQFVRRDAILDQVNTEDEARKRRRKVQREKKKNQH